MSDFGADIFDREPPPPPPPRRPASPPAPVDRLEEVALQQPRRVHDDLDEVVFARPAAPPAAPAPATREPRPQRPAPAERPLRPRDEAQPPELRPHHDRTARPDRGERHERERPERAERPERTERHERHERPERHERHERRDRPESHERREFSERRRHESDRPDRRERTAEDRPPRDHARDPQRPTRDERRPLRDERPPAELRELPRGPHREPPAAEGAMGAPKAAEPPRAAGTAAIGQRIGILIDLDGLRQQAQQAGGEIAFRKLLHAIAGDRAIVRALCYASGPGSAAQALGASGFEVVQQEGSEAIATAIAVDAMAMAARIDVLVLAPASRALPVLVHALRAHGVRVEAASLDGKAPPDTIGRRLGRDCVFVP